MDLVTSVAALIALLSGSPAVAPEVSRNTSMDDIKVVSESPKLVIQTPPTGQSFGVPITN